MSELHKGDIVEGKYRVLRLLGEGGMNRVYLVEDLQGTRKWALKLTKSPTEMQATQPEVYNKFLKEVSMLMTLKHPNLPAIEDYFPMGSQYRIIEEYLEGQSLEEHITHNLPGENEVVGWALTLCEIFQLLHSNNVIFRDLKPANIILTKQGTVKLIDFDIARYYSKGKAADTLLLGTPGYAAPETYGKSQSDPRSDIYTLGATLHHLLTGVDPQDKPFHFEPVEHLRSGITKRLCQLVEKCVRNKPDERFQTIMAVKNELVSIQAGMPSKASSPFTSPAAPAQQPASSTIFNSLSSCLTWILVATFVFALIGGIMESFNKKPAPPSSTPRPALSVTPAPRSTATPTVAGSEPWLSYTSPAQVHICSIPELSSMASGTWLEQQGSSMMVAPDTYCASPEVVCQPYIRITPGVARPGRPIHVKCVFMVHYHPTYSKAAWMHTVNIYFAMPENEYYTRTRGSFVRIPGKISNFTVSTPDRETLRADGVILSVDHDNSWVTIDMDWAPLATVPPLKYSTTRPWEGPRFVINVNASLYAWIYTKGFVVGAKEQQKSSPSKSR